MDILTMFVLACFTAVVGAIVGAIIASEIGIRRTEKRLRRLVTAVAPQIKQELIRILSDEEIKQRARSWIDDVLLSRAPEIVRNLTRAALNGASPKIEELSRKLATKGKADKGGES